MHANRESYTELAEIKTTDILPPPPEEEDWKLLEQEDVRDLQTLFDYFASKDTTRTSAGSTSGPAGVDGSRRGQEDDNSTNSHTPTRKITALGMQQALASIGIALDLKTIQQTLNRRHFALESGTLADDGGAPPSNITIQSTNVRAPEVEGFTYEEFVMMYAATTKTLSSDRELREVFRLLDDDYDGFLSVPIATSIFAKLLNLNLAQTQALMLKSYDPELAADHNIDPSTKRPLSKAEWITRGKMSYDEFVHFMNI